MKTYTIELTAKEIKALQIALCSAQLELIERTDHLADHNKTGINTKKIEHNRNLMNEYESLFDKLYEVQK